MRPESELVAEEVAFVNTCGKMAEILAGTNRGRHTFSITVYDGADMAMVATFGPAKRILRGIGAASETKGLTLEESDSGMRTGQAELPPMAHVSEPVNAVMEKLEEELPFEVPVQAKPSKRKGK